MFLLTCWRVSRAVGVGDVGEHVSNARSLGWEVRREWPGVEWIAGRQKQARGKGTIARGAPSLDRKIVCYVFIAIFLPCF